MIKVLQIIDSLNAGGAERLAVNYANGLTQFNIQSHLCVTRSEGPLLETINKEVGYLFLNRTSTLDINAMFRLKTYVSKNDIDVIHAHSSSFFIATLMKSFLPNLKIVWHDHYGNSEFVNQRPKSVLRICSKFFSQVFSVNIKLETWAKENLWCKKVKYLKNFAVLNKSDQNTTKLKGIEGKRIVCLANLREQKNHIRLIEAFQLVVEKHPEWSLHCVGKNFEDDYSFLVFSRLKELHLSENVHFYGTKPDIANILKQCEIGVLVSKSEGLPLALLEYGFSCLPVIVTNVGECSALVSDNTLGILLDSDDKHVISNAISKFIEDKDYRLSSSKKFNAKISKEYSEKNILGEVVNVYNSILVE